jgi:hypothetical protein
VQRSQVFSTSQRFAPPLPVTALFHAAGTSGVFPFRAFPSTESVAPLDARSPLDVSSRSRPYAPQQAVLHTALSVRPSPGGFPLQSPFTDCRRLSRTIGPMLSWVSAPPRVSHDLRWRRLHGPFSHALQTTPHQFRKTGSKPPRCPGASLTRRVAGLSPLPQKMFETAVLPGVPSLVTLHTL